MFKDYLRNPLRELILPLAEIQSNLPSSGTIVDLGCGEGIIAKYLAQDKNINVIGVDKNKKRLPKSQRANLSFIQGNIVIYKLPKIDGVVISDVLHHINFDEQLKILTEISKKLTKNGVLVIKEIDKGEFVRSRLSRFWDFILYPSDAIYYRDKDEMRKVLNKLGFSVKITRPCRLFPGSTTLYICSK